MYGYDKTSEWVGSGSRSSVATSAARRGLVRCGLVLAALVSCAALVAGCGSEVIDPGEGVGDPCVPSVEYEEQFAGFSLTETSVEVGAADCQTGVCLVNHFQGRVSCPEGQAEPEGCAAGQLCADGSPCTDGRCPASAAPAACQVPGTSAPIAAPVCGQCSSRSAQAAVYCSCRCGLAEGEPPEAAGPLCRCPLGYQCREVFPYLAGLSEQGGKYCVKAGTEWSHDTQCGFVAGYWEPRCEGTPVSDR